MANYEDLEFEGTDESLLTSLDMIDLIESFSLSVEFEFKEVENELSAVWNNIEESEESVYKCGHCEKICKSQGGLKLHQRKKHPDVNENKPDYEEMAREKLPPLDLEIMIHKILDELSKDECYPKEMQNAITNCTQLKVSHDHALYKECIKYLAFMYKKNDPEQFYEKFYSSLPLQAETILNKIFPEIYCKVIILRLGDKLLAFSKPSSSQISESVQISLKDAEHSPLNYLGGYILQHLYRKYLSNASKKSDSRKQEKEEFWTLLDSLHVDESVAKDTSFISVRDRGGLWYPKKYMTNIFVTEEIEFRVHTGKEVCHKICVDKIVDKLLQKPVLRSKRNMLLEECGCEITKGRSIIFIDQILSLFIKIRSFSYAKNIVQKYKIQQKVAMKKGLRKQIKRATDPNVQG